MLKHNVRPTAGVAMCVYNGASYLREQLESIAAQTELPLSMVILDDGSTDGSWELLQDWAARAPFPVRAARNEQRLGVARNFEQAVTRLDEDVIVLCDQDDIWYPGKVEAFVGHFAADPALALMHSDADLVDGDGKPLGGSLLGALHITARDRGLIASGSAYRVYARRNIVTGAACAFRRSLLEKALPFSSRYLHDEWLAYIASLVGKVRMLERSTMAYRLHGANTVGVPLPTFGWRLRNLRRSFKTSTAGRQAERADRFEELVAHARSIGAHDDAVAYLARAAGHARFRANLPRGTARRLAGILRECAAGHYHAWSTGSVSVLHDLLIAS